MAKKVLMFCVIIFLFILHYYTIVVNGESVDQEQVGAFEVPDNYQEIEGKISDNLSILLYVPFSIHQNSIEFDIYFEINIEDPNSSTNIQWPIIIQFSDMSIKTVSGAPSEGVGIEVIEEETKSLIYIYESRNYYDDIYSLRKYTINFENNNATNYEVQILKREGLQSLSASDQYFIEKRLDLEQCTAGRLTFGEFSFNFNDVEHRIVLPFSISNGNSISGNNGEIFIDFKKENLDNICPDGERIFRLNNGEFEDSGNANIDNIQHKINLDITQNCLNGLIDNEDSNLIITVSCTLPLCCETKSISLDQVQFIDLSPTMSFKGCQDFEEGTVEYNQCLNCLFKGGDPNGEVTGAIWTEIGCIDPSPAGIITRIFQIGLGLMGGIAVLRVIQIAYLYQQSDPQKVEEASSLLTSLIAGLILMILGVVILQFLGINVLGLPQGFLGG